MKQSTIEKIMAMVDNVSSKMGKLSGFLFLLLTATVLFEVVSRYVFNAPTIWAYKFTAPYLWGSACLCAGAWVQQKDRHVSIDLLPVVLTIKARTILSLVLYLIFFFPLLTIIVWKGIDQAIWSWTMMEREYQTLLHAPIYPIKTLIPIMALLLLLQGVVKWIREARSLFGGTKL